MISLVASDLDGTLLRPDVTISERTRKAVHRIREAGITFVAVTGRPPRSVRELADSIGLEGIAICANGALVYDLDRDVVVDQTPLAAEVALRIVRGLRAAAPGVAFAWEDADSFGREPAWGRQPLLSGGDTRLGDPLELLTSPVIKVLVRHPEMDFDELAERARAVAGDEAVITWSARELVEVSGAGVTKAFALERVCARLGVASAEVLAIGDNENDLAMLRWAGRSAAVANASPNVLAMVDEVTASNLDDGVALLLEGLVQTERSQPHDRGDEGRDSPS
ncbi:MAG TPA: Cof-type HAD-IIB family hydrolase [Actinomycetes bacterium]|jgi:Cof subfamily protein (haloacid dehalogenase superfamily)|nr:Cof-type HAD-IIB family hydrolase [Actinomycetes bacterium]